MAEGPAPSASSTSSASSSSTTVRVRFRPRSSKESDARCVEYTGENQIGFTGPDGTCHGFTFDKIYDEATSQADVFTDLKPVVEAALAGYNGTIMAYGQTGSGKTHTLIGGVSDPVLHGVVPRAIGHLAAGIGEAAERHGADFEVVLSVVEIYCERIRDLLEPAPPGGAPGGSGGGGGDNLQVKQDALRGVYIEGATELYVTDEQQLVDFMTRGLAQRSVSATSMNEASSRSHCIVTVRVSKTLADGTVQMGKLTMVDLAGSERVDRTHAAGATLVEGALINKSLSCLSNVIYALTEDSRGGKPRHVPYRDSKLTRVLQDSLGGSARTVLIVCCSPCRENAAETLSSLRFGSRAKGVQNTLTVNQRISPERLMQQLEQVKVRNAQLEEELAALRASGGDALGLPAPRPPAAASAASAIVAPEPAAALAAASMDGMGGGLEAARRGGGGGAGMHCGGAGCGLLSGVQAELRDGCEGLVILVRLLSAARRQGQRRRAGGRGGEGQLELELPTQRHLDAIANLCGLAVGALAVMAICVWEVM